MKFDELKLLTDENLHPRVVQFLGSAGFDVLDVTLHGLIGRSDLDLTPPFILVAQRKGVHVTIRLRIL